MTSLDYVFSQTPDPAHINARLDAKAQGKQLYDGRKCRHDGTKLRFVIDDYCVACARRIHSKNSGHRHAGN